MPDQASEKTVTTKVYEESDLLTWRSPERVFKLRSKEFYSTVIVLAFLVSVVMFFIEGVMPVLVIWALVFVVLVTTKTPPGEASHQLTNWGIRTAGKLYRYETMAFFWIEEKWGSSILHIALSVFPGQLVLIIEKKDEEKIKKTLTDFRVHFQKPDPTVMDKMLKWFSDRIPMD